MVNKSLRTIGTNYRKNCMVSEDAVPIHSKMQNSALRDVCYLVTDGTHDTPKTLKNGVPLIKAKEIVGGIIDFENCEYISYEDHLKVIARSNPEKGDILFAHIGASLGETAFIKTNKEFSIKNVALFKPNPSKIDNRYLFYYVISSKFQNEIKNCRTGSAQPFVSLDFLRNHPIKYHTNLETQHKIAAILSAYDDLIENNTRRIKILEEMVQTLYREWFVKFRFPGHERVKMVESELGMVPEGWEVNKVKETFEILGGGTPSKKVDEYWENGEIVWYTPSDLTSSNTMFMEQSSNKITELGLKKSSAKLFPPYSIMMTSRATLGIVAINTTPACTNQGFITCLPNERVPIYYIYYWLLENTSTFLNMASGATFKEISKTVFKTIDIILPSQNIRDDFQRIVEPLVDKILNLQRKNTNLRRTRNLLLPKLISGKVDVENIDVQMPNNGGA